MAEGTTVVQVQAHLHFLENNKRLSQGYDTLRISLMKEDEVNQYFLILGDYFYRLQMGEQFFKVEYRRSISYFFIQGNKLVAFTVDNNPDIILELNTKLTEFVVILPFSKARCHPKFKIMIQQHTDFLDQISLVQDIRLDQYLLKAGLMASHGINEAAHKLRECMHAAGSKNRTGIEARKETYQQTTHKRRTCCRTMWSLKEVVVNSFNKVLDPLFRRLRGLIGLAGVKIKDSHHSIIKRGGDITATLASTGKVLGESLYNLSSTIGSSIRSQCSKIWSKMCGQVSSTSPNLAGGLIEQQNEV